MAVLDADPTIAFVSCWLRTFGDEEWEWKPERCDLPALLWEDTVLTAALVRREAVVAAGGYDTAMPMQGLEDWDLWLTLVGRGCRGAILREVLFNYRRRAGSLSTISWYGSGHLPLTRYRLAKHSELYRTHLVDMLLHQDAETATLLRRNDELERELTSELEPAVALRREELATLRTRLAAAQSTSPVDAQAIRHRRHRSGSGSAGERRRGDRASNLNELAHHRAIATGVRAMAAMASVRMTPGSHRRRHHLPRPRTDAARRARERRVSDPSCRGDRRRRRRFHRPLHATGAGPRAARRHAGRSGRRPRGLGGTQPRRATHVGRLSRVAGCATTRSSRDTSRPPPRASMRSRILISSRARCAHLEAPVMSGRRRRRPSSTLSRLAASRMHPR